MKEFSRYAIFAGMLIGVGGLTYLRIGGVVGATLFAFGLLCILLCKAQLFTSKAGFLPFKQSYMLLPMILFNALGCALMATMLFYIGNDRVTEGLQAILTARATTPWHGIALTSIGTGMIMTLAVYGVQRNNYLPLLFGVPVFILCGLPHCMADAFYYAAGIYAGMGSWSMLGSWSAAIVGNYIGCNIPRLVMQEKF
ncbi:MAG: formate/nitrite transporter family protein [Alistipes sp.]|nr:formate/nitrite transporter family protein [Alistipes sp.]